MECGGTAKKLCGTHRGIFYGDRMAAHHYTVSKSHCLIYIGHRDASEPFPTFHCFIKVKQESSGYLADSIFGQVSSRPRLQVSMLFQSCAGTSVEGSNSLFAYYSSFSPLRLIFSIRLEEAI